ncbi:NAD(P)/FAD-dependent oxidoreductase [Alkalisalibacterium limincola]|uniref:FAD-dependent oxidoreductase n=1 Tax=Alkalisalibacterium limincola TaxID=2699169 RepID=A0A5C8KXK1_9GAMM|nr:FAD-dependent oxidoreductase [Alkalisalibacterium limincola]TXK65970.1 FAD-dependent oxidoreductase [Alkalisalibacterium limincola]
MDSRADDVLIIGGGVIGLACAWYLLKAGRQVRVVEQGAVGSGSSYGNCGTITPSHAAPLAAPGTIGEALKWMLQPDAPFYIRPRFDPELAAWLLRFAARCNRRDYLEAGRAKGRLLNASRLLLADLVEDARVACDFEPSGLIHVYRDARRWEHAAAVVEEVQGFGIEAEAWSSGRLALEEPSLLPDMAGGLYFPGDASLRPDRLVVGLAQAVREAGGIIDERCRVTGFSREASAIGHVDTERGRLLAREVVLASGAWSAPMARGLGLHVPVQPGKGYSITYSRPSLAPRRPLVLEERRVCVTAWSDGFRLGSTMEFSGYDSRLNPTRLRALVRGAGEYLREPEGPVHVEDWYGWRPMTWDDLPIIGRVAGLDNMTLATGHGMLGVSLSAVTGHLVADLLCGREPVVDPRPSNPGRFRGLAA